MFEETVLRFSDKSRQQQLATDEHALAERQAELKARRLALVQREAWMKQDPVEVDRLLREEDARRAAGKDLAAQEKTLKARYGLSDKESIDNAGMRGALEVALAEKEHAQAQRQQAIDDRTALMAGFNKLALLDAARASELLHAHKEITIAREWARPEVADMFARAQRYVDANGSERHHAKTLDGWAGSLAMRQQELAREESKLDMQEANLRARVRREMERRAIELDTPEKSTAVATTAAIAASAMQTPDATTVTQKQASPVQLAAERVIETTVTAVKQVVPPDVGVNVSVEAGANATKQKDAIDTSLETLQDPARFATAVEQYAKVGNVSAEQATESLSNIRRIREEALARSAAKEKAAISESRSEFWGKSPSGPPKLGAAAAVREREARLAQTKQSIRSEKEERDRARERHENKHKPKNIGRDKLVEVAVVVGASASTQTAAFVAAPGADGAPVVSAAPSLGRNNLGRNKSAALAGEDLTAQALSVDAGIGGAFKRRSRNKSKDAVDMQLIEQPAVNTPVAAIATRAIADEKVAESSRLASIPAEEGLNGPPQKARQPASTPKDIRNMTRAEKSLRRQEYMQDRRASAGLSADGRKAVTERARQSQRKSTQRDMGLA